MEILDIVDENGIPTGETILRTLAHKQGARHRTSHVWIARMHCGQPQLLLQKRSKNKDSHPGCYDISSAGHIPAGSDFISSALRELREELGISAKADELIYCGTRRFQLRSVFHGKPFLDNQVSNVYVLWRDFDPAELSLQKEEVEAVVWIDYRQCLYQVENRLFPNCIYAEELHMLKSALQNSKNS